VIRRVVILGGTGFLGQVAGRHSRAAGLEVELLGSKQVDLTREGSLDSVRVDDRTAILLAAALTRDVADDDASLQANLAMARHVAQFARNRRPGLLVYLSSVSVYGRSRSNPATTEETPPDLDSGYARAKHGGEELLLQAGVPLSILRVCQVYGPTDTHVTYGPARFLDGIRRERKLRLFGEGEEQRDFLFEEDFGKLVLGTIQDLRSGVLNLATGTSRTFADAAAALQKIVPFPFEVVRVPRKVPLVHQGFDIARLRGFFPGFSFTPLERGLRESWERGGVR
jgi:nucleoside-diphosphate-sugar epimerase